MQVISANISDIESTSYTNHLSIFSYFFYNCSMSSKDTDNDGYHFIFNFRIDISGARQCSTLQAMNVDALA